LLVERVAFELVAANGIAADYDSFNVDTFKLFNRVIPRFTGPLRQGNRPITSRT
jgi:hypothetical protein